jgi:flagellar protein FlaJ
VLDAIFLRGQNIFYFIVGIACVIGSIPFFVSLLLEESTQAGKDRMFLEFSRNLVESVKAGTPISKSILNMRGKDYGPLNPYLDKLANQIALGIPVNVALQTFARDLGTAVVKRAITIMGESEKAGGNIEDILEAVSNSIAQIEKLKKERKAAIYNLVVQGYIIFMVFIAIMLVMQFKVLPIASELGGLSSGGGGLPVGFGGMGVGSTASTEELTRPFIYLLIVQGFFAGLVIGKLSEGSARAGLKHSFILVLLAILISTGAKDFLG